MYIYIYRRTKKIEHGAVRKVSTSFTIKQEKIYIYCLVVERQDAGEKYDVTQTGEKNNIKKTTNDIITRKSPTVL